MSFVPVRATPKIKQGLRLSDWLQTSLVRRLVPVLVLGIFLHLPVLMLRERIVLSSSLFFALLMIFHIGVPLLLTEGLQPRHLLSLFFLSVAIFAGHWVVAGIYVRRETSPLLLASMAHLLVVPYALYLLRWAPRFCQALGISRATLRRDLLVASTVLLLTSAFLVYSASIPWIWFIGGDEPKRFAIDITLPPMLAFSIFCEEVLIAASAAVYASFVGRQVFSFGFPIWSACLLQVVFFGPVFMLNVHVFSFMEGAGSMPAQVLFMSVILYFIIAGLSSVVEDRTPVFAVFGFILPASYSLAAIAFNSGLPGGYW